MAHGTTTHMAGVLGLSELPLFGWRRGGLIKHLAALQEIQRDVAEIQGRCSEI